MRSKRYVIRLHTVFHLRIKETLGLAEEVKTGILFIFDREGEKAEYVILSKRIDDSLKTRINRWLHDNLLPETMVIRGMGSGDMDADTLHETNARQTRMMETELL